MILMMNGNPVSQQRDSFARVTAQFSFFSIPGGPAATGKCRAGTDRPAPTQPEAGDTATQGRPSPLPLTIVDLRLSAALAAQAAP